MYRIKRFSIQSGAPNTPGSLSRELKNKAVVGAIGGGIIGILPGVGTGNVTAFNKGTAAGIKTGLGIFAGITAIGAIAGMLTALGADRRRAKATKVNMTYVLDKLDILYKDSVDTGNVIINRINIWRYIVTDEDPSKYVATFAYEDGVMIILLKSPSNPVLSSLNSSLENMIRFNRKADYVAEETEDGYVVKVICPNVDAACSIIAELIYETRTKVNCLTDKKLNY